jgi:hypothetical protein
VVATLLAGCKPPPPPPTIVAAVAPVKPVAVLAESLPDVRFVDVT